MQVYLVFLFAYLSREDDHTGVRVIKRDECGGGNAHKSAGCGSSGQGVSRVQVECSLTATTGRQERDSGELFF